MVGSGQFRPRRWVRLAWERMDVDQLVAGAEGAKLSVVFVGLDWGFPAPL